MCQQRLTLLPIALVCLATLSTACHHYHWGTAPPNDPQKDRVPDGPVVSTVSTPPDWGLDGNELAEVTVRALHRHGAPHATRTSDDDSQPRVRCHIHGNRPDAFGRHHLARVRARCHWESDNPPSPIVASATGSVSTTTPTSGGPSTTPRRHNALRTASRQALSRAAARLLSNWRSHQ